MGASGLVCAPAFRKLAARDAHTRSPAAMALACAQAASTLRSLCPPSADGRVKRPLARCNGLHRSRLLPGRACAVRGHPSLPDPRLGVAHRDHL